MGVRYFDIVYLILKSGTFWDPIKMSSCKIGAISFINNFCKSPYNVSLETWNLKTFKFFNYLSTLNVQLLNVQWFQLTMLQCTKKVVSGNINFVSIQNYLPCNGFLAVVIYKLFCVTGFRWAPNFGKLGSRLDIGRRGEYQSSEI